jgi:hypothetical protein
MTFEEIDPRVIDTMRQLRREAEDAEYEASTPGADAWRDRVAQRHRFGRALDEPEVHDDREEARWLVWFALYLAAVVVALVVIWLVAA